MISLDDCKVLIRDLSIKTGKSPLLYGKKLHDQRDLDYAVGVIHAELRQYEHVDIEAAFNDTALQDEVASGYSGITNFILRKYIKIHKGKRERKEKDEEIYREDDKDRTIPIECVKALAERGIYLQGAVKSVPDVSQGQTPGGEQKRKDFLASQKEELMGG